MIHVSVINTSTEDGLLLVANDEDQTILGFTSVNKGLYYYEEGYRHISSTGYTGQMSALMNNITFQPSIVTFKDVEELFEVLYDGTPEGYMVNISNVSGRAVAFKIPNQANAKEKWDSGVKPRVAS